MAHIKLDLMKTDTNTNMSDLLNVFFTTVVIKPPISITHTNCTVIDNLYVKYGMINYQIMTCMGNKAIRDGKYLARHMPVLGNVHPIKIENLDIFS